MTTVAMFILSAMVSGCGGVKVKAAPQIGPDMSGVLRVTTRFGLAHACPISPTLAITSAHVVDPRPFDQSAPLFGGQWTTAFGGHGSLKPPIRTSMERDLATVRGEFPRWFPIAPKAPNEGVPVYALGYSYKDAKKAFADVVHKLEVVRIVGGLLILRDSDPQPGSSGGCIFNAQGEVLAVIDSGWDMESGERVIAGVAVWGESFAEPTE